MTRILETKKKEAAILINFTQFVLYLPIVQNGTVSEKLMSKRNKLDIVGKRVKNGAYFMKEVMSRNEWFESYYDLYCVT